MGYVRLLAEVLGQYRLHTQIHTEYFEVTASDTSQKKLDRDTCMYAMKTNI